MVSDVPLLWLLARASGLMSYACLTVTVLLGIAAGARPGSGWWPKFVTQGLHRAMSATALALLAVHVVALVLDPHAGLTWIDTVVPFKGSYKWFWTGLGTVALDVLLAVAVTSLFRSRLGPRLWRLTHTTAYAAWALGLLHGLGVGTDSGTAAATAGYAASFGMVFAAVLVRAARRPVRRGTRVLRVAEADR